MNAHPNMINSLTCLGMFCPKARRDACTRAVDVVEQPGDTVMSCKDGASQFPLYRGEPLPQHPQVPA